jgi:Protein of unknown function (DUF3617)
MLAFVKATKSRGHNAEGLNGKFGPDFWPLSRRMTMRGITFGVIGLGLALSGCGGGDKSVAASSGPVKRAAGSWKNEMSITKFEVPGAPPEAKQMMEGMMKMASAIEVCLTPEQAAKDDVAAEMAKGGAAKDCQFSKKEVSGGVINVEGVCKDPSGQQVNLKVAGTAEPKKTDASIVVSGNDAKLGGAMNMEMKVSSSWTGPCKPGQLTMDGTKSAS